MRSTLTLRRNASVYVPLSSRNIWLAGVKANIAGGCLGKSEISMRGEPVQRIGSDPGNDAVWRPRLGRTLSHTLPHQSFSKLSRKKYWRA
jgi:hypothetical protein